MELRAIVRAAFLGLGFLLSATAAADTVRAELLIMEPGSAFFSCTGHAGLRLESEERQLERCYSYESEDFGFLLARFLSGRLKMGMFRVPTEVFLEPYARDRRGVKAYRMDVPSDVCRELWRVLDEKTAEGVELPYDYLERGCAQSVLRCFIAACARCGKTPVFPEDRPYYHLTCREAFGRSIPDHPWTFLFLHLIVGTDADREDPRLTRIRVPADLLDLLQATTLDGRPVLADSGTWIVPSGGPVAKTPVTPLAVALALLLAVVVAAVRPMAWLVRLLTGVLLALCTVLGLVVGYTVFCTHLPGTTWNWLLVPFNPLLALCWRWRRWWAVPYGIVIAAWIACMMLAPHVLTHPAYLVLALAICVHVLAQHGLRGGRAPR